MFEKYEIDGLYDEMFASEVFRATITAPSPPA
jgi:hypothetical protein